MKPGHLLTILFILLICQPACGKGPSEALKDRATRWGNLLLSLPDAEQEGTKTIEEFIEPSSARPERAREYYIDWKRNIAAKMISFSVDEVTLDNDPTNGMVRYSTVVEYPSGERKVLSQRTKWKSVNGVWYRIIEMPEMRQ